jgi:mRNA-degrading endonuclease RelE of RelBE toxin-antitoxin system
VGGLNPCRVEFDLRVVREEAKLSVSVRRRIRERLEFLRAAPFRSHPGVSVKEVGDLRGVWRFHVASDLRVFYPVVGDVLWVTIVEKSAEGTKKTVREVRRRR